MIKIHNKQTNIKNTKPYGSIYLVTNIMNRKVYVGKVEYPKTLKERWDEHLREGRNLRKYRKFRPDKKIWDTHLNNAIAKYDENIWDLIRIDIAYTKEELNQKERYWIKKYESMNREKGYNMTEGGDGGKFRQELIEKIREKIKTKWEDPKYKQRQSNGVKKKWQDPIYRKKMIESAKKRSNNQIYTNKLSKAKKKDWENHNYRKLKIESVKKQWQNKEFREKVCKSLSEIFKIKWQDPEFRNRQLKLPQYKKKEVNKREFLTDLKNSRIKKELEKKYNMSNHTINKRIKEILGKFGIKNYSEARKFLDDKDMNRFLNEI